MISYLLEIRQRLIKVLMLFGGLFVFFFFFSAELLHSIVKPLLTELSGKDSLIATHITSAVFIPITLAANAALLCSVPVLLYQAWRFIAPALYVRERHTFCAALTVSVLLFFLGMMFCFYLILPFMFQFFLHEAPSDVQIMPDITYTIEFITRMLLLFGLCFQVPIICVTLVALQWIDIAQLRKIRPYVIVGAFIIGMLLTPPDVFSQIILAVPLCLLYELGIWLCLFFKRSPLSIEN